MVRSIVPIYEGTAQIRWDEYHAEVTVGRAKAGRGNGGVYDDRL